HPPPCVHLNSVDDTRDLSLAVLLEPPCRSSSRRAADFTDQDHRIRTGTFIEQFHAIEVRQPADGIATYPDASRLAITARSELPHSFVSERAGARDHADVAGLMNVPWHDADLACTGSNYPGAIRPYQPRSLSAHQGLYPHHVHHWNSLRDTNDQFYSCIHGFKN